MHWIAFGDIHENTSVLASIPDLADADAVIVTGDVTNRGSREAARRVISAVAAVNSRIYAQPGNMDTDVVQGYLCEHGMDLHRRVRELTDDVALVGVGLSTPTPFGTPSEVPEATLAAWLDEAAEAVAGYEHVIAAIHEPPADSALDMVGGGQHVGSPAVRAFIERVQPAVAVTGHIHESVGVERMGRTTVVNPGMLAGGGYVRIDFVDGVLTAELKSV